MQKNIKLKENKVLFEIIKKEKTYNKAKYKVSANFAIIKLNTKFQEKTTKKKKKFVKWQKFEK